MADQRPAGGARSIAPWQRTLLSAVVFFTLFVAIQTLVFRSSFSEVIVTASLTTAFWAAVMHYFFLRHTDPQEPLWGRRRRG
ncbi:hypothetical protein [Nocardioides zeae]|uniref:Uncharacterized protein n=1 Tax=Nocardioides zeae TaxID=1457234 RepID=A0A6P0HPL4_9ACTN|nr:hypothetical protein [Nocardioides zeae]NEN80649.1 hypothetical protein [Nocardioides zeae]